MKEKTISEILAQDDYSKSDLVRLLQTESEEKKLLFRKSAEIKL